MLTCKELNSVEIACGINNAGKIRNWVDSDMSAMSATIPKIFYDYSDQNYSVVFCVGPAEAQHVDLSSLKWNQACRVFSPTMASDFSITHRSKRELIRDLISSDIDDLLSTIKRSNYMKQVFSSTALLPTNALLLHDASDCTKDCYHTFVIFMST